MHIKFFEIQAFRKLQSIRVDLDETTTLLVGANNSGKTSAMEALSRFLLHPKRFSTNDFTLSNWIAIDRIGKQWEDDSDPVTAPSLASWEGLLPTLDVWLEVGANELHYVRSLLPSLDWAGGMLGVRLRLEPNKIDEFKAEYTAASLAARKTKTAGAEKAGAKEYSVNLWPSCMRSFLDRRLRTIFTVKLYLLDPTKQNTPVDGEARPQKLSAENEPVEGNPLSKLIRIDEIPAQRGLGERVIQPSDEDESPTQATSRQLSEQMKAYYSKHLDPSEHPEPEDLDALEAIETAQKAFDHRLQDGFAGALEELQDMNYPGVTDPVLRIATRLRPVDGLSHSTAVQYELMSPSGDVTTASLTLPEEYNGLGYQNLILMVFRLMSFRDAWMRVGKAAKSKTGDSSEYLIPPLHLVIVEEPEAHLHVQVQQVFVRKALDVLRRHTALGDNSSLRTQLIVSTHSSHIAHECEFSWLRYFRRLPAKSSSEVPTSIVMNLEAVFGEEDATARFAARYLLSTHSELFFADAAIFVEGAAERLLVPHFIKHKYKVLHRSYVTLLEISGSHAHRLRSLIEGLGLTTLIIGDLDSVDPANKRRKSPPRRGGALVTANPTLKQWHPAKELIDELLDVTEDEKIKKYPIPLFNVRVAYQIPVEIQFRGKSSEVLARTFEDSIVLENIVAFAAMKDSGAITRFNEALADVSDIQDLSAKLFSTVDGCDKAAFALDVLWLCDPGTLTVPKYIDQGLAWLTKQLDRKKAEVLATAAVSSEAKECLPS